MEEGRTASRIVTFTDAMVSSFAEITEDNAPVHLDQAVAHSMGFNGRIVHGFLVSSMYSTLLGCHLPGPDSIIQKLSVDLVAPVYIGDTVEFVVKVARITEAVRAISLALSATNGKGILVSRGSAVCILRQQTPISGISNDRQS
jgi:acyl dehydratase